MFKKAILLTLISLLIAAGIFVVRLYLFGKQSQKMKVTLGFDERGLKPCGEKPNCASTQHPSEKFKVDALPIKGSQLDSIELLSKILSDMGAQIEINEAQTNYLRATFQSKIFGFIDDVEFYLDTATGLVHMRSASRVGYSDLGANKKRLLEISKRYLEAKI